MYWICAVFNWIIDSNNLTAISTFVIAIFTVVLAAVGYSQARLIRKSIDLARKEFVSTQRPKLRVRNITITQQGWMAGHRFQLFREGEPISGQFFVSNIGGTAATITESFCMVFATSTGLPMRRPYEGKDGNTIVAPRKLEPGQSAVGIISADPLGPEAEDIVDFRGSWRLYIIGWIEYTDEMKTRRRTAFCRLWRYPGGPDGGTLDARFFPVDDEPDYEHEE
jgi:hypothetical protein